MRWSVRGGHAQGAGARSLVDDVLHERPLGGLAVGLKHAPAQTQSAKLVDQPTYSKRVGPALAFHALRHDSLASFDLDHEDCSLHNALRVVRVVGLLGHEPVVY
jgi:hypothetical protein